MFIVIIRTAILYFLVFAVMRMMGKRQIGQLQPYELAVAIMISALAAIPMEDVNISLVNSVIPILLILFFQVLVSVISLKFKGVRAFICGKPSIVIENGKIVEPELRNLRVNINDLLEQLRLGGHPNIADVEFAIMETNGQLSVIPKSQKRPLNPEDLNIPTEYEGICHPLIFDGQVDHENLSSAGLSLDWLETELGKFGIGNLQEVFFASLDTTGKLYFQQKEMKSK
ncbi:MAG: DUF421 domain-containing protein [Firmicutes bacterium]|nr:DUF421 domain-containing protein [Bacillota bacterium]